MILLDMEIPICRICNNALCKLCTLTKFWSFDFSLMEVLLHDCFEIIMCSCFSIDL